ncbi:MAG: glycosyltransferase [Porphyrobacter sp.]|nr:glycosyltransferase [Porphyrobacter sp.]
MTDAPAPPGPPFALEPESAPTAQTGDSGPDLSVLVVAYNSARLIEACIASVAPACTRQSFEILLIDNGDGSTEALVQERFPEVRIIPSRGNIGFAAGNNALASHARGRYLLLLNPDMKLFPRAIDALFEGVAAYPGASAWGGVTVDAQGCPDTGNAIPMPSLGAFAQAALGRYAEARLPAERLEQDSEAELLMGGFVMFTRSAWEAAKGLDDRYFLYCEEVDLFHRLTRMGHRFWRIAAARGYHAAGHGDGSSPMRMLYHAAGTTEFMRVHWSPLAAELGKALFWIAALERYLAGRLLGRRIPKLQSREKAYHFTARRPGLWWHGYDKERGLLAQLEQRGGVPL